MLIQPINACNRHIVVYSITISINILVVLFFYQFSFRYFKTSEVSAAENIPTKSSLDWNFSFPDFREGRPKKFNQKLINLAINLLESQSYKEVEKVTSISKSPLERNKRKLRLSFEGDILSKLED